MGTAICFVAFILFCAHRFYIFLKPGGWLSWLERCAHIAEVTGSNPVPPTKKAIYNLELIISNWERELGDSPNYSVYILRSLSSKRLYIGQTNNFQRRFREHQTGRHLATRNRGPWEVLHILPCQNRIEATTLERKLKNMKRPDRILKYIQKLG